MKDLKKNFGLFLTLVLLFGAGCENEEQTATEDNNEWISIWDGETFENWRASENTESFQIEDGKIVVDGPRSHLFYEGPVEDAD
ncbi:MAG: hypothetical protein WED10_14550, partial [Brumimicrobium sp.]